MSKRSRVVTAFAVLAVTSTPASASAETAPRPVRAEWIADGVLAAAWLAMIPALIVDPSPDSRIGPSFRGPEDVDALEEAAAAGTIGHPHDERETVPDAALGWMLVGTVGGALLVAGGLAPWIDSGGREDGLWFAEQGLSALAGMVHAIFGTYMLTSVAKVSASRLRPDFADRADRYYCWQSPIPELYRPRCSALEASGDLGPAVDEATLMRGRRSFWSGHSSLSFAAATYASLLIGGRLVWGRTSNAATRALGIILQGSAMAAAAFAAGSRVTDGVHHMDDVLVGSVVGITMACLGYFLHFDLTGEVRRGVSLSAGPAGEGVGIAAQGTF